jgi:hypothetical protein
MNYLVINNQGGLTIQYNLNGHQANLCLSYSPHPFSGVPHFYAMLFNGPNGMKSSDTPFLPCQFKRIIGDVLSFTTNKEFSEFLNLLHQCHVNNEMDVFYERYVSSVRLIKNANY